MANTIKPILIVEDDSALLLDLKTLLEAADYQVVAVSDGFAALAVLESQPIAMIISDIAMPRMNGYQLFGQVRANPNWITIPFLFLSARSLDSDIRYGKSLGVNDYLIKPIEAEDLWVAVANKLKRTQQLLQSVSGEPSAQTPADDILIVGRLRIEPSQYRVFMDNQLVQLSAREFALLEYMANQPGQVLSPQELVLATHQYNTDYIEAGALIRPLIRSLRRKLGFSKGDDGCIENVRGIGYRLIEL